MLVDGFVDSAHKVQVILAQLLNQSAKRVQSSSTQQRLTHIQHTSKRMNDLCRIVIQIDLSRDLANGVDSLLSNKCRLTLLLKRADNNRNDKMHVLFRAGAKHQESVHNSFGRCALGRSVLVQDSEHQWQQSGKIDLEFALK